MSALTKQQLEYIKENIGRKSKRAIARDLKIDKKLIHKYIKDLEEKPAGEAIPQGGVPSLLKKLIPSISPQLSTALHVALIFSVALLIRLIYLKELSGTYFFTPFEGGFDDYMFNNWAKEIIRGNWLDDKMLYIYRMPLYGYFLAAVYFIFGVSHMAAFLANALIGSVSCVLVYVIGRMVFNRTAGLIAGLFNALAGPLLFYTGMLVGEILGIFIACLAFIFLLFFERSLRKRDLFISGILMGASLLIKGSMIATIPLVILWVFYIFRKYGPVRPLALSAALLIGAILPVSAVTARNYICEKDFVPVTASGGLVFYIGNAYGADGKYREVPGLGGNQKLMLVNSIKAAEERSGKKLKPSEVSRFWFDEAVKSIKNNGAAFLVPLALRKLILFWNSYELPDIWDYYFFKDFVPVLRWPLFTFLTIIPLSFAGIYMGAVRKKNMALLLIFVAGYMLALLTSFVNSRYRIHVFPFLSVLAAYGLVGIFEEMRENKVRAAVAAVIMIVGFIFSNIAIEKTSFETSYNSLGIMLKRSGKADDAVKAYNKALEMAPRYPTPYYNLGILYRDMGRNDLAASYFKKAIEVAPDFELAKTKLQELGAVTAGEDLEADEEAVGEDA